MQPSEVEFLVQNCGLVEVKYGQNAVKCSKAKKSQAPVSVMK